MPELGERTLAATPGHPDPRHGSRQDLRHESPRDCGHGSRQDAPRGWEARLELRFESAAGETRLVRNRHEGPLRLLKTLRSEDDKRIEAVIVHPPGGLVGGDSLSLDLHAGAGSRVLSTTPGAQKWYRADLPAFSGTLLVVGAGACLEWLPQPAIVFDGARVRQSVAVELSGDARCIGWEALVRGRGAMGESFDSGLIDQTLSISVSRQILWQERLHAAASDRLFGSPLGWQGRRAAASVWCCAPSAAPGDLMALRDRWRLVLGAGTRASGDVVGGASIAAEGLLLAKILAADSEYLMAICRSLWRAARTLLEGDAGSPPRIWRT